MDDDALLARFAALRAPIHNPADTKGDKGDITSLAPEAVARAAARAEEEDAAILAVADSLPREEGTVGDAELAELLAGFNAPVEVEFSAPKDDGLERDVAQALRDAEGKVERRNERESAPDAEDSYEYDGETEEEIFARALAEARLEGEPDRPRRRQPADVADEYAPRFPDATPASPHLGPARERDSAAGGSPVSSGGGSASSGQKQARTDSAEEVQSRARNSDSGKASKLPESARRSPQETELQHPEPGLPSLPTLPGLPDPVDSPSPTPEAGEAADPRLAALLGLRSPGELPGALPSVPTSAPRKPNAKGPGAPPRRPGQGFGIAGWDDARDEDLDTWCYATMRCLECNDLYCAACWREHNLMEEHRGRAYVFKR